MAHELGHAVHKDVPRLMGVQIAVQGIYAALIGFILQSPALAQAFGLSGIHFGFSLVLFGILSEPLDLLISLPVNAISRRAELYCSITTIRPSLIGFGLFELCDCLQILNPTFQQ